MANKDTQLSIIIRAIDKATAPLAAINERIARIAAPIRVLGARLSGLADAAGLPKLIDGFKGVGSALAEVLGKVALIGGAAGAAVAGLFHLVDGFDELGDKAEAIGVSVDFLAQMRYAAERSGASIESLDSGLQGFSKSLGQARAGAGKMAGFLAKVSPALLRQLKAAKSNEAAFDLLAGAMAKLEDPAKRAALAQVTLGDAALGPLFAKGPKGIKELRDRYLELAGSQEGAAGEAGKVDDAMKDLKASTDGIKAALVQGLAPALKIIVEQLRDWFTEHRADIKEWAASIGRKLPDAFRSLVGAVARVVDFIRPFVDSTTKLKVIAGVLAAIVVGPLVSAIYTLGVALLTTPVGWIVGGIAAIAAGAYLLITNWDAVSGFFTELWDTVQAKFGWVADSIAILIAPFIYIPAKIIDNWDSISSFFVGLWDGITSVFERAWEIIGTIIDKVVGAVDTVKGAASAVGDVLAPDIMAPLRRGNLTNVIGDVSAQARGTIEPTRSSSTEARVTVDFANAPRGTRVRTDPQSSASVDLSVGYQMGMAP